MARGSEVQVCRRWLLGLLVLQSMSSIVLDFYSQLLKDHLVVTLFLTMLVGAGGNAGNQSAIKVIRGLVRAQADNKPATMVRVMHSNLPGLSIWLREVVTQSLCCCGVACGLQTPAAMLHVAAMAVCRTAHPCKTSITLVDQADPLTFKSSVHTILARESTATLCGSCDAGNRQLEHNSASGHANTGAADPDWRHPRHWSCM